MATCYTAYELATQQQQQTNSQQSNRQQQQQQKDYSRPLHVDCSVEYELPNAPKPPLFGTRNEPLLMIHPCYFRKIESQRRSPFINNLPPRLTSSVSNSVTTSSSTSQTSTASATSLTTTNTAKRRIGRLNHHHHHQQQQPQQQHHHQQYPNNGGCYHGTIDKTSCWDHLPPLVPISIAAAQTSLCNKQETSSSSSSSPWTTNNNNNCELLSSPDRPTVNERTKQQQQHILSGKYRQYLRAHNSRLHPYVVTSATIPTIASTFAHHQIQQVCYNV